MSKRGSNSELFAHENDALPLGHSSTQSDIWLEDLIQTIYGDK